LNGGCEFLDKKERFRVLFLILAIGGIVRLYLLINTAVIAIDGIEYINCAKAYASFDFSRALSHFYPPLYPVLIAFFNLFIREWELAGQVVSLVAGVLLIFPVYFLAMRLYGERIAILSALLAAVHPQLVIYSAQVRSESAYFALSAFALYFGWRAVSENRLFFFLLLGFFSSLSYLTRPEGICILLLFAIWHLIGLGAKPSPSVLRRLLCIGCSFLPSVPLVGAYILVISGIASSEPFGITLSLKRSVAHIFGYRRFILEEPGGDIVFEKQKFFEFLATWASNFVQLLGKFASKVFHPLLMLFLLVGVFHRKTVQRRTRFETFILVYFFLFIALFSFIRVSTRHPTQLIAPLLVLPAIGLFEMVDVLNQRFRMSAKNARLLFGSLVVLLVVALIQQFITSNRGYLYPVRFCGEWIKQNSPYRIPRIATDWARIPFYADGLLVGSRSLVIGNRNNGKVKLNRENLEKILSARDADYVVFAKEQFIKEDEDYLNNHPRLVSIAEFLSPENTEHEGPTILLFEVLDRGR